MKTTSLIAGLSFISLVTACAPAGYYDSNGEYRSYGKSDSFRNDRPMAGTPQTHPDYYNQNEDATTATTTVIYDRPGYYDYNGYYISAEKSPSVPPEFLPPRGMCRVWFTDRAATEQPQVESCRDIQHRVPAGAYVIYGG